MIRGVGIEAQLAGIGDIVDNVVEFETGPGEIACSVESFALTANNITYAAHGTDMGYWKFFPASRPDRGVVPVWGFGRVIESRADGVAVGDRFYGYWPMASHARLTPTRVTPRGFVDGAAHRAGLPAVYNGYQRIGPEGVGDERVWALFRPLYITSFLLGLDVAARGVERVVLSSASSKTALGMAQAVEGVDTIGLTSAGNVGFVERTDYFARVLSYDAVGELDGGKRTAFYDFSGNGAVRLAAHRALGEGLAASVIVGDTHWEAANGNSALPGPAPELFFAPTVLQARLAEWGQAGFDARLAGAWAAFTASAGGWLELVEARGAEAAMAHYAAMVAGEVDPARGIILSLAEG